MKKTTTSISISKDFHQRLKKVSKKTNCSASYLIELNFKHTTNQPLTNIEQAIIKELANA